MHLYSIRKRNRCFKKIKNLVEMKIIARREATKLKEKAKNSKTK
jgi:hypothetical protein